MIIHSDYLNHNCKYIMWQPNKIIKPRCSQRPREQIFVCFYNQHRLLNLAENACIMKVQNRLIIRLISEVLEPFYMVTGFKWPLRKYWQVMWYSIPLVCDHLPVKSATDQLPRGVSRHVCFVLLKQLGNYQTRKLVAILRVLLASVCVLQGD